MTVAGPPAPAPMSQTTHRYSHFASPVAMAVVIPLLVLVSGVASGWITRAALRSAAETTAAATLIHSTRRTAHDLSNSLDQADPVLGALRAWMLSTPDLNDDRTVARTLLAIVRGRSGVASANVSTADGGFHRVDQRGSEWTYTRATVPPAGETLRRSWRISENLELTPDADLQRGPFDVRQRPPYLAALAARCRTWTKPYPFFASGITGITCAEPLLTPEDPTTAVRGVIAVDFNLESLGGVLQQIDAQFSSHSFLFTNERVLVGLPELWRPNVTDSTLRQLLTVETLNNALVSSYFATLPVLPTNDHDQTMFLVHAGEQTFAATAARFQLRDGPTWYVGMLLPRELLMGEADRHLRWSLVIGLVVLAMTSGVALWFARHLASSRQETTVARTRAHDAEAAVIDLGAYRLIKLLGKGGMGEVWLAQHRMLARPAAIKLIKAETLEGRDPERREEIRKRFSAEARITANLRSRNTIELYDYGIADDGTFFYVMELLDGIDLFDLVMKYGRLSPARVVPLLVQACHSLAEAHDRGLVHRDIKPENIFLCRRADEVEVLKVLDFGIVRMLEPSPDMAKTRQGLVQGTPATMSPEQATDRPLDGRSDLYSLGCVAYWLITGKPLFESTNTLELMTDHVQTAPVPPSQRINQPLPPALEKIILKCLVKDPKGRPADARELARDLLAADLGTDSHWTDADQQTWWKMYMPPCDIILPTDDIPQVFRPRRLDGKAK